jgi:uncharacterized OB-fold protein
MSLPFIEIASRRSYPPRITAFTRIFWEALSRGSFVTSKCEACDRKTFPPKPICPHCWSGQIIWVDLSPRGTLYSATTVHAAPAAFASEVPYRVGIVDLTDGLRIATKIVGDPVPLDSKVEIVVLRFEDGPLFAARPVTPG